MKSARNEELWWDRHPGRLDYELAALDEAGIKYSRDDEAFGQGILRLELVVDVGGTTVNLVATFPDLYPYFRFEVAAPDLDLGHHQNPIAKNLCLMGRSTHYWHASDTLAGVLREQLEKTLIAGDTDDVDVARGLEQHQAEPFSEYYIYSPSMFVLGGDWLLPTDCESGQFRAVLADQCSSDGELPRGLVVEVTGASGEQLARAEEGLAHAFSDTEILGRWVRIDVPISQTEKALKELVERHPSIRSAVPYRHGDRWHQMWAVVFPEEGGWRTARAEGWLFISLAGKRNELLSPHGSRATGGQKRRRRARR